MTCSSPSGLVDFFAILWWNPTNSSVNFINFDQIWWTLTKFEWITLKLFLRKVKKFSKFQEEKCRFELENHFSPCSGLKMGKSSILIQAIFGLLLVLGSPNRAEKAAHPRNCADQNCQGKKEMEWKMATGLIVLKQEILNFVCLRPS